MCVFGGIAREVEKNQEGSFPKWLSGRETSQVGKGRWKESHLRAGVCDKAAKSTWGDGQG